MQPYCCEMRTLYGNVKLLSCDDKAKIKFGEPNHHLATIQRNRPGIVPKSATLAAEEHDVNNKGSLTPSVVLDVEIPQDADDSFYVGQVYTMLQCSIYEPSNSFRAVLQMESVARSSTNWEQTNILVVYTDGGPERMITHESVKVPLCTLFRRNPNLDIIIALRTAPGQSYVNYVERIMSILNIALQNCSLSREQAPLLIEKVIDTCSSWEDFVNTLKYGMIGQLLYDS